MDAGTVTEMNLSLGPETKTFSNGSVASEFLGEPAAIDRDSAYSRTQLCVYISVWHTLASVTSIATVDFWRQHRGSDWAERQPFL